MGVGSDRVLRADWRGSKMFLRRRVGCFACAGLDSWNRMLTGHSLRSGNRDYLQHLFRSIIHAWEACCLGTVHLVADRVSPAAAPLDPSPRWWLRHTGHDDE
jgi:hypothetical protein